LSDRFGVHFQSVHRDRSLQDNCDPGWGAEWTTANTTESARAATTAFQSSLEKGRELSRSSTVTRELLGARLSAEVTLENPSDVAFRLSNVEIRVATTDPQNPGRLIPVATLLPETTLETAIRQSSTSAQGSNAARLYSPTATSSPTWWRI